MELEFFIGVTHSARKQMCNRSATNVQQKCNKSKYLLFSNIFSILYSVTLVTL